MPRLYTRNQGGVTRYYADLRDIGGGQVALKSPGSNRATTDEAEAFKLLGARIEDLEGQPSATGTVRLGPFVKEFIRTNPGGVTEAWLHDTELRLQAAASFFGFDRELVTIEPKHIREWLNKKLSHLAGGTQRHYLHSLSGLYRYAQEFGYVPLGYNPVSGLYRKPRATKQTTKKTDEFFEIDTAAKFLEAAKKSQYFPVIATYLLTGGRRKEVLGLTVGDIDFENKLVRIQPNRFRGLKRIWSERAVPLWPQLEEILKPHVESLDHRGSDDLLFPGRTGGMITDLRKPMREISKEAACGMPRLTKFRHTYATARLQTTDNGRQISLWTVAKELGHENVSRVEDTYGHPNHFRPRGEVVEYRV